MFRVPLRVQCKSEESALQFFHSFPPDDIQCLQGWSTKRNGASQLFILYVTSEEHVDEFTRVCLAQPEVQNVSRISENEYDNVA